jgi:hypothetical protein
MTTAVVFYFMMMWIRPAGMEPVKVGPFGSEKECQAAQTEIRDWFSTGKPRMTSCWSTPVVAGTKE